MTAPPDVDRPGRRGGSRTATLDGLRGIAVLAVVIEHAWAPLLPGGFAGVDVFFVLSGYLITGLLATELAATGRIDLTGFYARRVRRIVPASLLAVAGTVLLGLALLGPAVPQGFRLEAVSAVFSFSNILFASEATDYFAARPESSFFLHYWSLAVEEQFYLVWPAFLLLLATMIRRLPWAPAPRWGLIAVLAVLGAASLVFALRASQTSAFFLLPFRGWELIAGGLLAILQRTPGVRLPAIPRPLQVVAVIAGAAALGIVFVLAPELGRWPGRATLLIVVGTLLLIAGGDRMPGARALANPPLRFFGRISYALYLWHWPLLAAATLISLPAAGASPAMLVGAVAAAIVIATASTILVEEPIRSSARPMLRGRRGIVVAVASMALVAVASVGLVTRAPGALLADAAFGDALAGAREDRARLYADECVSPTRPRPVVVECVYGAGAQPDGGPTRAAPGQPVVVLFGDSHAVSWFAAIDDWSRARGYALVPLTRLACGAFLPPPESPTEERAGCQEWRELALERIEALAPVLTIVASSRRPRDDADPWWRVPAQRLLEAAAERSASVMLLGDVPRAPFAIPDCLGVHRADPARCALPLTRAASAELTAVERAAAADAGVHYVDPTPFLCDATTCTWITNGRVGWFDEHHLTASGARSALPELGPALDAAAASPTRPGVVGQGRGAGAARRAAPAGW